MQKITEYVEKRRMLFCAAGCAAFLLTGCVSKQNPIISTEPNTELISDAVVLHEYESESTHARDKPISLMPMNTVETDKESEFSSEDRSMSELLVHEYPGVELPSEYSQFQITQQEISIGDDDVDQVIRTLWEETYDGEEIGYEESYLTDQSSQISDAWVYENTDYSTVEELRAGIYENLQKTAVRKAETEKREELITQLIAQSSITISKEEVLQRVEEMVSSETEIAAYFEKGFEDYIREETGLSAEEYKASLYETAEEELRRKKIVSAFAEKEGVDVSVDAWKDFLTEEAAFYGYESGENYNEEMQAIGLEGYLRTRFLEKQAGNRLEQLSSQNSNGVVR